MNKAKRDNWRELAQACEASGMSVWGWCRENKIPYTTCRSWFARLRREKQLTGAPPQGLSVWGKVRINQEAGRVLDTQAYCRADVIKLTCGNWGMEINSGFDHMLLAQLMQMVEARC